LLVEIEGSEPALGAERRIFSTNKKGLAELSQALEQDHWTTQRERPAFLTWLALSWQAGAVVVRRQLRRRRQFLESEVQREKATLDAVLEEVGHPFHEAVWMISLTIEQFELELRWLRKLERELPHRAPARRPGKAKKEPAGKRKRRQAA
jgi:hypothetical protein